MEKKKPYTPPRLVVHGDVRHVTQSRAKNQNKDGGDNSLKT